jgi:ABC-type bacteriocin/lantibiotic exporter with double-glycine peptidase domain
LVTLQVEERTAKLEKVSGEVEFCNVAFRYKNTSKWVLNDFSLKVRAGETVALVGKLLLRLYDPVQGDGFGDLAVSIAVMES